MMETNIQFNDIYQALTELASQKEMEQVPCKVIGFKIDVDKWISENYASNSYTLFVTFKSAKN